VSLLLSREEGGAGGVAGADRQRGGIHIVNRRVTVESAGRERQRFKIRFPVIVEYNLGNSLSAFYADDHIIRFVNIDYTI